MNIRRSYDIRLPVVDPRPIGREWCRFFAQYPKAPSPTPHHSVTLLPVDCHSPMTWRKAVYKLACFFRREFRYDFVQWGINENNGPNRGNAFLWVDGPTFGGPVIGACCLRWRKYTDAPAAWALAWAWFHPYERNRGHLSAAWPLLRQVYGDFVSEPPLSHAMQAFLGKHGAALSVNQANACVAPPVREVGQ